MSLNILPIYKILKLYELDNLASFLVKTFLCTRCPPETSESQVGFLGDSSIKATDNVLYSPGHINIFV